MAKLILLAFTIATLLAFTSAHITTTIEDDTFEYNTNKKQRCSQHLQDQQLQQCQTYLQQPDQTPHTQQQQTLQQCCQELQNIDEQCRCKAVKQVFGEVQQQQQETGPFGSSSQQLKQKAENLPKQCNLQTKKKCNIKTGEQCRKEVQRRKFDRCQKYLEQTITGSGGYLRTAVWKRKQADELEECCEEIRNVDVECQCEAMKEVMREAQEEEQRRPETAEMRRVVQNLKNQCNLEVERCQIPFGMF